MVVKRPSGVGAFEFAVVAGLRALQLTRGCTPRVKGPHKLIVIAQLEVSEGTVARTPALMREITGDIDAVPVEV